MQSGNPALNKNTFLDVASGALVSRGDDAMTINGTVNKTGFLLILVLVGAMFSWSHYTARRACRRYIRWCSAARSAA